MSERPTLELETAAERITFAHSRSANAFRNERRVYMNLASNESLPMRATPVFTLVDMEKSLLRMVRGHTAGLDITTYVVNTWGDCRVTVVFSFVATSPKKVISADHAWEKVTAALDLPTEYKTLEELVEGTVRRCLADEAEKILEKQRHEEAQDLAGRIARHCDELARERCGFEEKMAALKDEVVATRLSVVSEVLAEIPERGEDGDIDPRVIAEAKALVPAKVVAWKEPRVIFTRVD